MKSTLLIAFTSLLCASASHAVTYSASNALEGATASFTFGAGSVQVVLTSLQANPISDGQELSGVFFTLSNAPSSASLTSASGTLIDIAANGSYSAAGGSIDHWGANKAGSTVCLAAIGACAPGGQPHDLIIGAAASYPASNASITNHNPSIQGPGTFILALTGLPADTTITSVTFEFGTTSLSNTLSGSVMPTSSATPEPSSLVLFGTGIVGAAGMLRRRIVTSTRS